MPHTAETRPVKVSLLLAYAVLYIVWGSTYLAIRFSVETIPPFFSGGVRFLTAGLILFTFRSLLAKKKTTLSNWRYAFGGGLLPFTITYGLLTMAERTVPSSITALIVALEPLWFCIIGWLCYKGARPTAANYIALALGFTGTALLVVGDPSADFSMNSDYIIWIFAIFISTFTWVFGAFVSRNPRIHEDSLMASGMQMLCGGAAMMVIQLIISLVTGETIDISAISFRSAASLGYLIIFGSIVTYSSFLWLLRFEPASRVSTHTFVNPIVAIFLGWLLGGETMHMGMFMGAPLIITSVVLMIWNPRPARRRAEAPPGLDQG